MKADLAREVREATMSSDAPRALPGRHAAGTEATDETAPPARPHLSPRTADLVERVDTGRFYLRTYAGGHYLWQPVADPRAAIPDTGTWLSGGEHQRAYWYNHGTYRRRAGSYYPVLGSPSATHAA